MSSSPHRLAGHEGSDSPGAESPTDHAVRSFLAEHAAIKRPPLFRALARDAVAFAFNRAEGAKVRTRLGRVTYALSLPFRASEYAGLALYRFRVSLRAAHVPILPTLTNWTCAVVWGIRIGDLAVVQEGVYIPHGQVVIDGPVVIGPGSVLCPWTTVGLVQGDVRAPRLGAAVFVGTGAKILGPVQVGEGARIGANAVVLSHVPAHATAVGVPARTVSPQNGRTS